MASTVEAAQFVKTVRGASLFRALPYTLLSPSAGIRTRLIRHSQLDSQQARSYSMRVPLMKALSYESAVGACEAA